MSVTMLNVDGALQEHHRVVAGNEAEDDIDVLTSESLANFGDDYEKSLRPSLADKLQVGFLASDQYTQTKQTEILDIQRMTATVKQLTDEMEETRRNLHFTKQVMRAAFEDKLQAKAFDMYTKLNERLRDLQALHEERVGVVRRSFKQQLQDALVKMASYYKKYYEDKLAGKLQSRDGAGAAAAKLRIQQLEGELMNARSLVQMLELQIEDLKSELDDKPAATIELDFSEVEKLQAVNDGLQREIGKLNDRIEDLNDQAEMREDTINQLRARLEEALADALKQKESATRLAHQLSDSKKQADDHRGNMSKELEEQKRRLESEMAKKLAEAEGQMADAANERRKTIADTEERMLRMLAEERKKFEMQMALAREEANRYKQQLQDAQQMDKIIEGHRQEAQMWKNRMQRAQRQWEKRFQILRASLHAIKDEGFVRAQLQKQAATLHYASVSYALDATQATPQTTSFQPRAPKSTAVSGNRPRKATVTMPSDAGQGTDMFSAGEEQDDDVDPELNESFVPLPPKPHMANVGDYMPSIAGN